MGYQMRNTLFSDTFEHLLYWFKTANISRPDSETLTFRQIKRQKVATQ